MLASRVSECPRSPSPRSMSSIHAWSPSPQAGFSWDRKWARTMSVPFTAFGSMPFNWQRTRSRIPLMPNFSATEVNCRHPSGRTRHSPIPSNPWWASPGTTQPSTAIGCQRWQAVLTASRVRPNGNAPPAAVSKMRSFHGAMLLRIPCRTMRRDGNAALSPWDNLLPTPMASFDMCANVHEWCSDWFAADYYAASPERNPRGPETGVRRASRGGSWRHHIKVTRCAARSSIPPHLQYADYGLRVACDLAGR